jgi:hypothetical protein
MTDPDWGGSMLQVAGITAAFARDSVRTALAGLFFLCLVALTSITPGNAQAEQIHYVYRFDTSSLQRSEGAQGTSLAAGSLQSSWIAGQPEMPFDTVTLLVPQGMRIARINAERMQESVYATDVHMALAGPRTTSEGDIVAPPDNNHHSKSGSAIYPSQSAEAMGSGVLHGYQLVNLRVYPVRYDAVANRLEVASQINLDIELEATNQQPLQRQRWNAKLEAAARRQVATLIDNREALSGYQRTVGRKVSSGAGGFNPSNAPSLEGSAVEYVIVTPAALEASMQVLADWKTLRGVPTVVRTMEWIEANYRHGSDLQETIRTFIQDAYAKWSVRYVLLAGDTDVLPARYGFSDFGPPTEQDIPSDMYFACLDGNWNADGDDLWGEAAINGSNPGDNSDFYAEVYIGRLPVSTTQEADNITSKIISYENPTDVNYQRKMLLLGEVLFPVDWDGFSPPSMDGALFSEEMHNTIDPALTTVTRLYENLVQWPADAQLTLSNTLNELNQGYGFVNHIGHGFRYNMACGDKSLTNDDAANLTNGEDRFILYMLNCTATAYDFPCLAEAYLDTPGGAVAVLGSSRAAFAVPSRNYNLGFFEAVHDSGVTHVGEAFVESRLSYTANSWFDTADHYTHLLYNILADPEMVIHTSSLGTTAANHVSSVDLGTTSISVDVTVDGAPRQGALVCLMKGIEEYVFGETDVNGNIVLSFVAETAGDITVTVSGQNMTFFQSTIQADDTSGPYVHATDLTLDDDDAGSSAGNGDGFIDAGETITIGATFTNDGTGTANNLTGVLRCNSPWASVTDSVYTLSPLSESSSDNAAGTMQLTINVNAPDGTVLALEFVTTDGVDTWTDTINRVVHAPILELTLMEMDDSNLGNDDGQIQAGESFELRAHFKNYGTGRVDDVQLTLVTGDPDITIDAGASSISSLLPLQESTGAAAFEVTENLIDENEMTLIMVDRWGRNTILSITLRPPVAPEAIELDATVGNGIIAVTFTDTLSINADVIGYHLYRSTSPSGPWTRVTLDRTQGVAYYQDTNLAPSTEYFYYATGVDDSGNESLPSPIANINTSPAQLSGWPIVMGNVSSCPPAAADITGDGNKELIAGNDALYAWTWSGIELLDDDNDPQTWGVFAEEIETITGAILVAEFDSSPGLEIFATTWGDNNKTFLIDGDGSILPGWPQSPNPTPGQGYWGSPGASDVDGDGFAEVFAPSRDGNLYAWNGDGSPVGANAAFKGGLGTWSRCSPTFANVDGDPFPEIIYAAPNATIHIWNADGTYVPNFPKSAGTLLYASSAVGDVNNDGINDVVVFTENDSIFVFDTSSGDVLPGWPVYLNSKSNPISPSPALADFDFDGFLEIVIANNHANVSQCAVQIYDYQGNMLNGWPKLVHSHTSESSPIVADFSGDGVPDVLFGNESGFIFGWDKDGNELLGFPLTIGDFIRSTPFADDIDGDGDIDLMLAGWDQNLWVWDFTAPWNAAAAQWPTFKHDGQRTGFYGFRPNGTVTDVDEGAAISRVPRKAFLGQNVPNPFNPVTRISYGVPAGVATPVRIEIFDARGRSIRQLVNGVQAPGSYEAIWDGRDGQGRRVNSGVFFYRLQVGATKLQRKMVLLK